MATDSRDARTGAVKDRARALGFDACGVARATAVDGEDRLGAWLRRGFHADMDWMATTREIRQDPRLRLPGARSVVVVARNYHHPRPASVPGAGKAAAYAWGRDYHKVLLKPLRLLAEMIQTLEAGAACAASIDTAPVMERAWAERAGIGWIGKNSLVLRRDLGSWFFLGAIITTVDLVPDTPVPRNCGTCRACLDACPTGALVAPQVVDARRCIAYHTIENRGEIPEELQAAFGTWVFGCDICQEVCPWNRDTRVTDEADFHPRPDAANPDLAELATLDEAAFNARFAGSPIRRAKHTGMVRNAKIAMKNAERENRAPGD